jgi:hypothetical protein
LNGFVALKDAFEYVPAGSFGEHRLDGRHHRKIHDWILSPARDAAVNPAGPPTYRAIPYAAHMADEGMSESSACALAEEVKAASGLPVSVEADDDFFLVAVVKGHETYYLRDNEDWAWLRDRILA